MRLSNERGSRRISRGRAARARKAARLVGAATVAITLGGTSAWAECHRSGTGAVTLLDLIPLASGTAISSIIASINTVNASSLAQSTAFVATPGGTQQNVEGGGNWSRVVAGSDEVKADSTVTGSAILLQNGIPIAGGSTASDSCRSTAKLNYVTSQAGMDIGRFRFSDGANFQWGFTAGYVRVDAKDKTPGIGTFDSDGDIPFAGLYVAISKGNFAFDAQVRGDYYSLRLNDVDQAMFDQPLTARGMAALANASYRFDLGSNWFLEPSIGGVFSMTDVDRLNVAGAIDLPLATTPSITFPGTVQIGSITSALGRASLRVGTTIVTTNVAWQPFGTLSVFHEFADSVTTRISGGASSLTDPTLSTVSDATVKTDRIGTYGHIGAGIAGVVLNTGWLGYVRGDYRFGENFESISVNAGLRYQFEPAKGSDGSVKDGEGYAPRYVWTGPYVGFNSGGHWGQQDWQYVASGRMIAPDYRGYVVGGQIGYDFQIGHTVFGIEADYNWSNAEGGTGCPNAFYFSCIGEVERIGFLTGRLGFALDRVLFYGKAGLAYADVTARTQFNFGSNVPGFADTSAGTSLTATGWAAGLGMEFAIDDRWSVKGEYIHYDLGSDRFTVDNGLQVNVETQGNIGRVGINYRFGHRGHDYGHDAMK